MADRSAESQEQNWEEKNAKLRVLAEAMERYEREGNPELFDERAEEERSTVRSKALVLLNHRMRSEKELRNRLLGYDYPPEVIDAVIEDLISQRLIDDSLFASEWVRQRHRKGKSRAVLDRELKDKGIADAERAEALAQVDDGDERSMAQAVAEKKARSISQVPADYAERNKHLRRIVGALARRGFAQHLSMEIAIAALEARIDELGGEQG
ncbi:Regulatory protein RecX [Corynebacterium ciconiae DSM 44920]|uniref:regulatory protein RecX n=1 Tax=Corynebacterium ciconiae TaxID=227319 RepID=UPI000381C88D|nr:regulatory protein RecX [Corynebacterium ciconiae]WKD61411.1 Regulatory protein RecX [Corynebacterium ciconiae DSM 44920]